MKRLWKISGGLNEDDIKQVHTAALELIEKIGILTPSAQALEMIEGTNGVKIRDNRVFIQPQVVEGLLGPFPKKQIPDNQEPSFHISGYSLRCYDIRTSEIKKPTTNDMVEFAKIAHSLGVTGSSIVMPQDIAQKLAEVATYKLCMDVSDCVYGAGIFSDAEVFDIVQEMLAVTGQKYNVGMHMISPMAFDPFLLEMA
ncbi:MAG: trimethylamine methyltransferase family protein [Candidatus Omnitrophica bacterium]|nr:trimethylamine methyltransferase family protein [Candidatus Omnitrophota bacterium]